MPTLVIVGAGYVGGEVFRLGHHEGYDCVAVSRNASGHALDGRWLSCDVTDSASLSNLRSHMGPVDLLVYAVSPGASLEGAYESAYRLGPRNALGAFPEARTILISSTRVFGQAPTTTIDDETRAEPDDPCSAQVIAGETAVLAQSRRNIVLRASGIYGPGRSGTAESLLGRTLDTDEEFRLTNRIHRDDLARIIFFLANQEQGGTFIASDPHPTALGTMQKDLKRIAQDVGFQPREARVGTRTRRAKSRAVMPSRLLSLGFQFRFPSFREGYEDIFSRYVRDDT